MLVTMTALGITSYMSIDYSSETLKERGGELLHGESDIRGESLKLLFETRIEQNKILQRVKLLPGFAKMITFHPQVLSQNGLWRTMKGSAINTRARGT